MYLPPPLQPGDTIAVVAPSSAPRKPERLERGLQALNEAGYQVAWQPECLTPHEYLAGSDVERATMLNQAIADERARAIMCVRGGYGVLRILNRVDYAAAKRQPKLLIGFSDITALHLALYHHAGWRGLSGPLVVEFSELTPAHQKRFMALAGGGIPPPFTALESLRTGTATGTVLGGNLSLLVRMIGSPHLPSLAGAILVLEDVGEAPYRIDALLAQLHLAGKLQSLGGVVLGAFTPRGASNGTTPSSALTPTHRRIFHHYFGKAAYPVATGLPYGHFPDRCMIPIGTLATLHVTPQGGQLTVLESLCTEGH